MLTLRCISLTKLIDLTVMSFSGPYRRGSAGEIMPGRAELKRFVRSIILSRTAVEEAAVVSKER